MSFFIHTLLIIGPFCVLITVADNIRLRRVVRQLMENQAAIVANALGNSVLVDGIELPKPDDERWVIKTYCLLTDGKPNGMESRKLSIGDLRIDDNGYVFYGDGLSPSKITDATKNYCAAVWKAYRSRVARKAIETST